MTERHHYAQPSPNDAPEKYPVTGDSFSQQLKLTPARARVFEAAAQHVKGIAFELTDPAEGVYTLSTIPDSDGGHPSPEHWTDELYDKVKHYTTHGVPEE